MRWRMAWRRSWGQCRYLDRPDGCNRMGELAQRHLPRVGGQPGQGTGHQVTERQPQQETGDQQQGDPSRQRADQLVGCRIEAVAVVLAGGGQGVGHRGEAIPDPVEERLTAGQCRRRPVNVIPGRGRHNGRPGEDPLPTRGLCLGALDQSENRGLLRQVTRQRFLLHSLRDHALHTRLQVRGVVAQDVAPHAGLLVDIGQQKLVGGQAGRVDLGQQRVPRPDQVADRERGDRNDVAARTTAAAMKEDRHARTSRLLGDVGTASATPAGVAPGRSVTASSDSKWRASARRHRRKVRSLFASSAPAINMSASVSRSVDPANDSTTSRARPVVSNRSSSPPDALPSMMPSVKRQPGSIPSPRWMRIGRATSARRRRPEGSTWASTLQSPPRRRQPAGADWGGPPGGPRLG